MNKRKLHHQTALLSRLKIWPLVLLLILSISVGIYGMRQNNFEMIRLRQAVVDADANNGDIEAALVALRSHVHGHMNTNLASGDFAIKPPIQLKNQYEKLAKAEAVEAAKKNKAIQKTAETVCAAQNPSGGYNPARINCIAEYMRKNAIKEQSIPSELYKFDFISPRWSPDLAGLGLLSGFLFFLLILFRLGYGLTSRQLTK